MDALASDPGSKPRDREAQPGSGIVARGRGDRRRRINRGSAPRPGKSHHRWRAIAGHPAIPENDEGPSTLHSALEQIEEYGTGRGRDPPNFLVRMPAETAHLAIH